MGVQTKTTHTQMKGFFCLVLAALCMSVSAFTPAVAQSRVARASSASKIQMNPFANLFGGKKDAKPTGKVVKVPKAAQKTGKVVISKSGGNDAWQAGSFGYTVPGAPRKGNNEEYRLKDNLKDFS